jgi:hypothetical protein
MIEEVSEKIKIQEQHRPLVFDLLSLFVSFFALFIALSTSQDEIE